MKMNSSLNKLKRKRCDKEEEEQQEEQQEE
jgi:hypothetical protein